MNNTELIKKYNVAAPRYTSYPTVPFWDASSWSEDQWLESARRSYSESSEQGISVYIHLPFCENLCTYCGCTTRITRNHQVEEPYIQAVVAEWEMYRQVLGTRPRVREIHLGGGTPTFFSAPNLAKLMQGIRENAEFITDISLSFEAHPANTTEEHLRTLYNEGFRRLSLGVQDFDPDVQKAINRRQTTEDIDRVSSQARAIGYTSINFDLIYGLPLQKLNSVRNTMAEVIRLRPDRIAFYSYAHVPWLKPGQRGYSEADLPEDEVKRQLYETGRDMLLGAGYRDIGMDHFSFPDDKLFKASQDGSLHRNFMGYTDQYTQLSIGLGVSAISDSWYAFAQNEKQVEAYTKSIREKKFCFLKGHILNDTDLVVRKCILEIMCTGKTTLEQNYPLMKETLAQLESLQTDGLVIIRDRQVLVSERGRAFLRNICMAFDERLMQNNPTHQIFSTAV